ncbi:aminotransferase class IV [Galbitalea sp. SE-J8]|uniref:aminotransferase class IV n=1 Tax=Galbitalea sp. SE-J8 TaxID=3054952 RepID=UPI00259D1585|nr:aminotransferase class IV [Galbitalea sp. SE-J8]MDM4761800.1 aminotransferase class IV [Galbitalea sp. SE-J8]
MGASVTYRWRDGALEPLDWCDPTAVRVAAADSWLVDEGRALAIDLHRARFTDAVRAASSAAGAAAAASASSAAAGSGRPAALGSTPAAAVTATTADAPGAELDAFWDAVIARIPRSGAWFPRVEWHAPSGALVYREREAPERRRSVVVATAPTDPRRHPSVKGPDLERMSALRTAVQPTGAGEAVILSPLEPGGAGGFVVEGANSALVWWRGELLMGVPEEFDRVDSVTERALVGLAGALGVETHREAVTPAELDGCEVWTLSALHGPRIVTRWVDGPGLAELPGRLDLWRARLAALRRPLPGPPGA